MTLMAYVIEAFVAAMLLAQWTGNAWAGTCLGAVLACLWFLGEQWGGRKEER